MARAPQSELLTAFGHAVRARRQRSGLSQEKLAEEAGIHRTYVGDVERGVRNVSLINIDRLASALDLGLSALMSDVEAIRGAPRDARRSS